MKIVDVSLTLFDWDGIPATSYGKHTGTFKGASQLGLLAVTTDDGVTGHAFLGSAFNPAELDGPMLIKMLKPAIMGQDPLDRERLNAALWSRARTVTIRTIGAVDISLWDIAGKIANMPIHQLLGSYRDRIQAYASSAVLHSAEAYADEAVKFKSKNWAAYKLHPPLAWREDIRCSTAIRKAVGDEFTLAMDAVWGYDYPTAVRVGLALQDLGYAWYEDPLADADIYNYVKLKKQLHIPIMATEYPAAQLDAYAPWVIEQATDYLRGDVAAKGGITTMMKTAHLAEAFHLNYEVHHGGNSLNNVANLHVIMALKNTGLFEVLLPDGAQKYGLVRDIEPDSEGFVHAPGKPGLGAEIDFELIERKKVAVLR
jgi:L-alanine-DL-glutamate epimerase-like enolase superfamily enzyme